jgi:GMP synthase (glutamine-hydrolysing)
MEPVLQVHVIQNVADPDTGWLGETLAERGARTVVVRGFAGDPMPDPGSVDALVVLGGPQGAYELDHHPYLADEIDLLRRADEGGTPVLGICLGGQLLAAALGGRAYPTGDIEYGYPAITLTEAGRGDPVLRELDGPVLAWHHDTFDLPPGGDLLAVSDRFPFAFRRGRSIGLQFHPEASPRMLAGWLSRTPAATLEQDRIDGDAWVGHARSVAGSARAVSARLFAAWLDEVSASRLADQTPGRP